MDVNTLYNEIKYWGPVMSFLVLAYKLVATVVHGVTNHFAHVQEAVEQTAKDVAALRGDMTKLETTYVAQTDRIVNAILARQ
jgi:hypothetical protein